MFVCGKCRTEGLVGTPAQCTTIEACRKHYGAPPPPPKKPFVAPKKVVRSTLS